jgi:hypothetical protein
MPLTLKSTSRAIAAASAERTSSRGGQTWNFDAAGSLLQLGEPSGNTVLAEGKVPGMVDAAGVRTEFARRWRCPGPPRGSSKSSSRATLRTGSARMKKP